MDTRTQAEHLVKHLKRSGIPCLRGSVNGGKVLLPLEGDDTPETLDYLLRKRAGFGFTRQGGYYSLDGHPFRLFIRGNEMLELQTDSVLSRLSPEYAAVDQVRMDVPFMIRLMEHVREDIKSDTALHLLAEQVVKLSQLKTLTVGDFNEIVGSSQDDTETAVVRTQASARLQAQSNRLK